MSDYDPPGVSRRQWDMWQHFHPEAGPPRRSLSGHEMICWRISKELSLNLLQAYARQPLVTPGIQDTIQTFRTAVQQRQYHYLFVNFWPHKKGLFGRGTWIAKPELWADDQESVGMDPQIFALGYIAAASERGLARRLKQVTDLDPNARIFENGREAISAMSRW